MRIGLKLFIILKIIYFKFLSNVTKKYTDWSQSLSIYTSLKSKTPKSNTIFDERLPTLKYLTYDAYMILDKVENLKNISFFRLLKANLYEDCPYWLREHICSTQDNACHSICYVDEEYIPTALRVNPNAVNLVDISLYDKIFQVNNPVNDYSYYTNVLAPESKQGLVSAKKASSSVYVDLTLNRPAYTAYKGSNIWKMIYEENCLLSKDDQLFNHDNLLNANQRCSEEETFYRMISGSQMLITVLNSRYYKLKDEKSYRDKIAKYQASQSILGLTEYKSHYERNLTYFIEHVAPFPDRIKNFYFAYGVLMTTLCNLRDVLRHCVHCETGHEETNALVKEEIKKFISQPFYTCDHITHLKSPAAFFVLNHFSAIQRFQNMSSILNCVECEACRLHGQVKFKALQLAVRTLGPSPRIKFIEVNEFVSLISALESFADGIYILNEFQAEASTEVLKILSLLLLILFIIFKITKHFMFPNCGKSSKHIE